MKWGKGDVDLCLYIKVLWTVHTPKTYVLTVYEAVAWSTTVLHRTGPQQGHKQHSFIVVTISQQLVTAEGNTIFHTLSQHEHTRLITTHITHHWYTLRVSTCVHSTDNLLMYTMLHISITIIYINKNTYVYVFQVLHVHAYLYNIILFLCVWYVKERTLTKYSNFFKLIDVSEYFNSTRPRIIPYVSISCTCMHLKLLKLLSFPHVSKRYSEICIWKSTTQHLKLY